MSPVTDARRLELCLRAFWGQRFELRFAEGSLSRGCFSGRSLLLPASARGGWSELDMARAAHAALHAELSPLPFDVGQLRPVQRAITSVLEDARVEALALERYPGLRRLWAPFHTACRDDGDSAPALLGRLARALFDATYQDPSGWVQRARAAWEGADWRSAGTCRELGSVLGNELGQLRLPFDPAAPTLEPLYRDDHRGLWRTEPQAALESAESDVDARREGAASTGASTGESAGSEVPVTHLYPEWDYTIARARPQHCAIREQRREPSVVATVPVGVVRRTRSALRRVHHPRAARRRCEQGAELDLSAVVADAALRARGEGSDSRLYRGSRRRCARSSTLLLLDLSASLEERELSLLQGLSVALAASWPRGAELAIHGFCSRGRQDVLYEKLKEFDEPAPTLAPGRARSGSTRLGAAIRHATALLCARRAPRRVLLVVSDGEPADIDVFDERYLTEDARRACQEARSRGASVLAWLLRSRLEAAPRRIFDAPGVVGAVTLQRLEELPEKVLRAYPPGRSSPGR